MSPRQAGQARISRSLVSIIQYLISVRVTVMHRERIYVNKKIPVCRDITVLIPDENILTIDSFDIY
jgi:hypothetical protein